MTRGFVLTKPIMLAMLLASFSLASAQTAAPDAGAVAQEYRDIGGRWTGASDAAMQSLAKAGGTLTNIVTGKIAGLSNAVAIADWSATLGTLSAGDVRGGVSGAAAIAVGGKITAGGAAFFGEAGAVVGGAVGTFFPVIGNIAGTMVGGAVGTTAGGFICAFGYDKYVKDYVAKGVLAGIAAVIDPLPMAEMRAKMDALMLQAMSPQEHAMLEASSTFGGGEVQLLDFGTLPYEPVPKQPASSVPATPPQQEAVLGDGIPASFELNQNAQVNYPLACTVVGARVSCFGRHSQGPGMTLTITLNGTHAGNVLEMDSFTVWEATTGCTSRAEYRGHETIVLEKGGRTNVHGSMTARQTLRDSSCKGPLTWGGPYQGTGSWRAN